MALGDARIVALKVVGALLLVVGVGVGLLFYANAQDDVDVEELRELAAGGGVPMAEPADTPASLWVNAAPIGSTVLIDGDSVGTTPLWMESVEPGPRWVRVVASGRTVLDTTLALEPGAMAELDLTAPAAPPDPVEPTEPVTIAEAPPPSPRAAEPRPTARPQSASTGDLRVTSSPSGAVVRLNGRRIGTTPVSIGGLGAGRHSVTVERGGYEMAVRQIEIRPGVQFETSIDLRPRELAEAPARPAPAAEPPATPRAQLPSTGTVEVLVRPWGRIVIDGVTHARETDVVYQTTLPVGTHRVTVSHPQLGSDERTITVQPGGVARIEFDLASGSGN